MKKAILFIFCFVYILSNAQQAEWAKAVYADICAAHYDQASDKVYFTGISDYGSVTIDNQKYYFNTSSRSYITEMDKSGLVSKVAYIKGDFIPLDFTKDAAFYFCGFPTGGVSFCMAKNKPNADTSWNHCYGSIPPSGNHSTYYPSNMAFSVVSHKNSLYAIGIYQDSLSMDGQWLYGSNALLAKFNPITGKHIWVKNMPGSDLYSRMKIVNFTNEDLLIGSDIYFAGSYNYDSIQVQISRKATILSKADTTGKFKWARVIAEGTILRGMSTDNNNNIYIAGKFEDSCKINGTTYQGAYGGMYVLKTDSLGNELWLKVFYNRQFTSVGNINCLATDTSGSVFITGTLENDSLDLHDTVLARSGPAISGFLINYSSSGNLNYALCLPDTTASTGYWVTADNDGAVYWSGRFYDQATIGNFTLNGNNTNQPPSNFLIKIKSGVANNIKELNEEDNISVYPNPSGGKLTLASFKKISSVHIRNVFGEVVLETAFPPVNIDLGACPKGIYFVEIVCEKKSSRRKVIVE